MQTIHTKPQELSNALDAQMPDGRWRSVLDLFVPTGVAEASQLQDATGLTRHKLNRALEIMQSTFLADEPLIRRLDHTITQPGKANRPPTIYLLGEGGARLLRDQGQDVRACELKEDTPISHAMCMLSVHIAATRAGLDIVTDGNLSYGEGKVLRPDHRYTLPDGKQVILEVEQSASPSILPRIMESLSNRQAFFRSEAGQAFRPEIRMLLNVKQGAQMRRTLSIWETAIRELFKNTGEEMAFRLHAMRLENFLEAPEWKPELSARWEEIRLGLVSYEQTDTNLPVRFGRSQRDKLREQIVLLNALRQDIQKRIPKEEIQPNNLLIYAAIAIFQASYGENATFARQEDGIPTYSLFLYKEFLNMNPDLRTKLKQVIHANRGKMVMNQNNILHRMNIIIRTFLRHFGWNNHGVVKAFATQDRQTFGDSYFVHVQFARNSFDDDMQLLAETATEWMLWALFEYAEDLELGRPEFW